MQVNTYDLSVFVKRLKLGRVFSFVRYGNGEWDCIFKMKTRTGSGSQSLNIAGLRQGLMDGITAHQEDETYLLAMQSRTYLARCKLLARAERWLNHNAPRAKWCCGEVFHRASMFGNLHPLIAQLRKMRVIVVGPTSLKGLHPKIFGRAGFVPVSSRDCYAQYKQILVSVLDARQQLDGPVVISFSAGPTAKVLIHDLHNQIGRDTFLIDFGSLWDIYAGHKTRKYHGRVRGAILSRNLTGK
jgi:hypothetical protein